MQPWWCRVWRVPFGAGASDVVSLSYILTSWWQRGNTQVFNRLCMFGVLMYMSSIALSVYIGSGVGWLVVALEHSIFF